MALYSSGSSSLMMLVVQAIRSSCLAAHRVRSGLATALAGLRARRCKPSFGNRTQEIQKHRCCRGVRASNPMSILVDLGTVVKTEQRAAGPFLIRGSSWLGFCVQGAYVKKLLHTTCRHMWQDHPSSADRRAARCCPDLSISTKRCTKYAAAAHAETPSLIEG